MRAIFIRKKVCYIILAVIMVGTSCVTVFSSEGAKSKIATAGTKRLPIYSVEREDKV